MCFNLKFLWKKKISFTSGKTQGVCHRSGLSDVFLFFLVAHVLCKCFDAFKLCRKVTVGLDFVLQVVV